MLIGLTEILSEAEKGGYAVPAFNVYNMETVMGVIAAAEEAGAPVILQNYSRLVTNEEGYYLAPAVLAAARKARVPVWYHLDHGASFAEVVKMVTHRHARFPRRRENDRREIAALFVGHEARVIL